MEITVAIITAGVGIITALFGFVISILTYRSAATKTELESLRKTIELQRKEIDRYAERLGDQENENKELRKCINKLEGDNDKLRDDIKLIQQARANTVQERDNLRGKLNELETRRIPLMEIEIAKLRQMVKELGGKPPTGPLKE